MLKLYFQSALQSSVSRDPSDPSYHSNMPNDGAQETFLIIIIVKQLCFLILLWKLWCIFQRFFNELKVQKNMICFSSTNGIRLGWDYLFEGASSGNLCVNSHNFYDSNWWC